MLLRKDFWTAGIERCDIFWSLVLLLTNRWLWNLLINSFRKSPRKFEVR